MKNQTQQKHTATPWEVDGDTIRHNSKWELCRVLGGIKDGEREANAEFIVKACNNYYTTKTIIEDCEDEIQVLKETNTEIVEALKELLPLIEMTDNERRICPDKAKALDQAQQALKKAK